MIYLIKEFKIMIIKILMELRGKCMNNVRIPTKRQYQIEVTRAEEYSKCTENTTEVQLAEEAEETAHS